MTPPGTDLAAVQDAFQDHLYADLVRAAVCIFGTYLIGGAVWHALHRAEDRQWMLHDAGFGLIVGAFVWETFLHLGERVDGPLLLAVSGFICLGVWLVWLERGRSG